MDQTQFSEEPLDHSRQLLEGEFPVVIRRRLGNWSTFGGVLALLVGCAAYCGLAIMTLWDNNSDFGRSLTSVIVSLVLVIVLVGACWQSCIDLLTVENITLTKDMVKVQRYTPHNPKQDIDPLSDFLGVMLVQKPPTEEDDLIETPVIAIELVHPDKAKSVRLWKLGYPFFRFFRTANSDPKNADVYARKLWLYYASMLGLPALEETPAGVKKHDPEHLRKILFGKDEIPKATSNKGSTAIRPDHTYVSPFLERFQSKSDLNLGLEPPPSTKLHFQQHAHGLTITYLLSAGNTARNALLRVAIGCGAIAFFTPTIWLVAWFWSNDVREVQESGPLVAIISMVALILTALVVPQWWTTYQLEVDPERINFRRSSWLGTTQLATIYLDELEDMEAKRYYSSKGHGFWSEYTEWALVLVTAAEIEPIGSGLTPGSLRWMKRLIIANVRRWYSQEGK